MIVITRGLIGLLFSAVTTQASAADNACDAVLNNSLMDTSNVVQRDDAASAMQSSYCIRTFGEISNSGGFSGGISYGIISADASKDEKSFNSWKNENCGGMTATQHEQHLYTNSQKALKPEAIAAWQNCISQSMGLACYIAPTGSSKLYDLNIQWRGPGIRDTIVQSSSISNGAQNGKAISEIYSAGTKLLSGRTVFAFERQDASQEVSLALNIAYDGTEAYSCVAYIAAPQLNNVAPSKTDKWNIDGKWCNFGPQSQVASQTFNHKNKFGGYLSTMSPTKGTVLINEYPPNSTLSLEKVSADKFILSKMFSPPLENNMVKQVTTFSVSGDDLFVTDDVYTKGDGTSVRTPIVEHFRRCFDELPSPR